MYSRAIRTLIGIVVEFLTKLKMHLSYNLALSSLEFTKRDETYIHSETCVQMSTALFVIARNWKQPRCSQNRILLNNKREKTTDMHNIVDEFEKHGAE